MQSGCLLAKAVCLSPTQSHAKKGLAGIRTHQPQQSLQYRESLILRSRKAYQLQQHFIGLILLAVIPININVGYSHLLINMV